MFNFKFSKSHIKQKEVNFSTTVNVINMSKTLSSYIRNQYFVYTCTVTVQCVHEGQRPVSGTMLRESPSIFLRQDIYSIWNSTIQLLHGSWQSQFRSSCLHSKHSADWAFSQASTFQMYILYFSQIFTLKQIITVNSMPHFQISTTICS